MVDASLWNGCTIARTEQGNVLNASDPVLFEQILDTLLCSPIHHEISEVALDEPIEMQAFFTERATGWEDFVKEEWLPDTYERYYTLLASQLPDTRDAIRILDLGCGGGIEFEWILKRAPQARITGVDQSQSMLDCLREKYAERLAQFHLIQDSYLTCSLEERAFDFAVTSMSVHYFRPSVRGMIYRRIERALTDDGIYIEGTYCSDSEEEERERLDDFDRRTAGLKGADSGRFKLNLPLRAETITLLLNEAGFPRVEWPGGEGWGVVTAKKIPPKSESRSI